MVVARFTTKTPDIDLLEKYNAYINTQDESERTNFQMELEKQLATIYGAKVVGGSQKNVPDYLIPAGSGFIDNFPFIRQPNGDIRIEAKLKRNASGFGTTIGQTALTSVLREMPLEDRVDVFVGAGGYRASSEELATAMKNHFNLIGEAKTFDFLATYAPKHHKQMYNKAKNLSIFSLDTDKKFKILELVFSPSEWNSKLFGVQLTKGSSETASFSFYYHLNSTYEKTLTNTINKTINLTNEKAGNRRAFDINFTRYFDKKKASVSSQLELSWFHSDSIPMLNVKAIISKKVSNGPSLPSIIDITQAVQGRVRLKMRRGMGEPAPPRIYERSGTFRTSIRAYINTKTRLTNYYYLPYYDSLEEHGYDITNMVETSVRAIAREKYSIDYNLRRSRN